MVNIGIMSEPKIKHCACVIHSNGYDWDYVDRLYLMLQANSHYKIQLHVFTEKDRAVPAAYIKHSLQEWPGVAGPKKSWWYKLQMFNSDNFSGDLLYMDLDVVITSNIDWIWALGVQKFCSIRDFRYLWRPDWTGMNSSVMFWNTEKYKYVWDEFESRGITATARKFRGDQDFLNATIKQCDRRFFDQELIKSWRWQISEGGLDIKTRKSLYPGTGAHLDKSTSIVIFHGSPKPHEINDSIIDQYWKFDK
jgi:hypothetical protein